MNSLQEGEEFEKDINNIIEKLTIDDVMKVYNKYFNYKDYYISVDKEEFPLVKQTA
jgi:predicted Zn-dependent peptidase